MKHKYHFLQLKTFFVLFSIVAMCNAVVLSVNATTYQSNNNYIPSQAGNFAYDGNATTKTSNTTSNQWLSLDHENNKNYSQNEKIEQAKSDFISLTTNTDYKPANCLGQLATSNNSHKINLNISCTVSIPNYAQVITSLDSLLNGGEVAWVCPGTKIIDHGGADTIFLENNDTCISNGGGAVIYAKSGSVVMLYGSSEIVYHEPGVIVNDISGGALAIIGCNTLIYDYTNAPVPGCSGIGITQQIMQKEILVYPNPVTDILNIITSDNQENDFVFIVYDYLGNDIYSSRVSLNSGYSALQLDVSRFKKGIYLLVISYQNKSITKKFTVQ